MPNNTYEARLVAHVTTKFLVTSSLDENTVRGDVKDQFKAAMLDKGIEAKNIRVTLRPYKS